jgi:hypothetical protein
MNHQPFEEWIINDIKLNQEQERGLAEHLTTCQSCSQLAQSWQAVQQLMEVTSRKIPNPGFTKRWQAQLANKRVRQQRRLAWWIFSLCLALGLVAVGIVSVPALASISLDKVLVTLLFQITLLTVRVYQVRQIITLVLGNISPIIPLTIWVLAATSLSLLCFLWVFSIWKLIIPKGVRS